MIVDYGVGNLRNVYKAVEAAGGQPRVVDKPQALADAAGVILPGVGAFGDAAANLRAAGFEAPLREAVGGGQAAAGHLRRDAAAVRRERGKLPAAESGTRAWA